MAATTLKLDIVSAEQQIFSGDVNMVFVSGELGELGIAPGHAQLLTTLAPGYVRATVGEREEIFYISGGMLEVQPNIVSVLADTALRAADLDESAALAAKAKAEQLLAGKHSKVDVARASTELAELAGQIKAIQQLKKRAKSNR